jgi:hypothetical protein
LCPSYSSAHRIKEFFPSNLGSLGIISIRFTF